MTNTKPTGDKRKKIRKIVKVAMPHCNVCGEMLSGQGSQVLPYRCSCGEWRFHRPLTDNEDTYWYIGGENDYDYAKVLRSKHN